MSRRLLALLILATTLPCLARSKPVTVGVAPVEAGSRAPASVATVVQNASYHARTSTTWTREPLTLAFAAPVRHPRRSDHCGVAALIASRPR